MKKPTNAADDVLTISDLTSPAAAAAMPIIPHGAKDDFTVVDADVAVMKAEAADDKKLPERAIEHDDGSVELPLFVPVVLRWRKQGSDEVQTDPPIHAVLFRRLTGKQVRRIMNSGTGDAFFAELTAAAAAGQFPDRQKWLNVLDRMDGADSAACIRIAQHFLENGPRTPGPRSSPN